MQILRLPQVRKPALLVAAWHVNSPREEWLFVSAGKTEVILMHPLCDRQAWRPRAIK
jgi:hypothetical protein